MVQLAYLHKVHRFPLHQFGYSEFERLKEKYYWDVNTTRLILGSGVKYIQEKLDGRPDYTKMGNMQIFFQNMRVRRVIPYTQLTHWEYVFAIWDMADDRWLDIREMKEFCKVQRMGFTPVLRVTREKISIEEIVQWLQMPSRFNPNHKAEGILVTNQTIRLQGKAINAVYDDTAENVELLKQDRGENVKIEREGVSQTSWFATEKADGVF